MTDNVTYETIIAYHAVLRLDDVIPVNRTVHVTALLTDALVKHRSRLVSAYRTGTRFARASAYKEFHDATNLSSVEGLTAERIERTLCHVLIMLGLQIQLPTADITFNDHALNRLNALAERLQSDNHTVQAAIEQIDEVELCRMVRNGTILTTPALDRLVDGIMVIVRNKTVPRHEIKTILAEVLIDAVETADNTFQLR